MYPSRFFLCLTTVMILQQSGVAPPVPVPDLDAFINVNTNVLDKFIQKKIDQAFFVIAHFNLLVGKSTSIQLVKGCLLISHVSLLIQEPLLTDIKFSLVIKIFRIGVNSKRVVTLYSELFSSDKTFIPVFLLPMHLHHQHLLTTC